MNRIALGIEYKGTAYRGWQSQTGPAIGTVQAKLDAALSSVANHPVSTICAGRTDAGVHARAQVVHCEVSAQRSMHAWVYGCNANLPNDIRVLWAKQVTADFDARRSACARRYKYVIYNNRIRPSLMHDQMAWFYSQLDADKMHTAAQAWLGTHDFASFRATGCQSKSSVRHMISINIKRSGDLIIFDIMANAFLYHMVRNMVGVLVQIGAGRKPLAWAAEVLAAKDRTKASITAPPQGLYLCGVEYPAGFAIPECKNDIWLFN